MADIVSPQKRSQMMAGIRGRDTKPELLVRRELHRRGFRFRLHRKDLPGRPDVFLPKYQATIFINGCFWHGHDCKHFRLPKTNTQFWKDKIERNRERDLIARTRLSELGIRYATVWECALQYSQENVTSELLDRICAWLRSGSKEIELDGL